LGTPAPAHIWYMWGACKVAALVVQLIMCFAFFAFPRVSSRTQVLTVDALLRAFELADERTKEDIRGVFFCIAPDVDVPFWKKHDFCSWPEILGLDPSEFAEAFSAIKPLRQAEIYMLNGEAIDPPGMLREK